MLAKISADQPAVPGPIILGVRRRMDADEALAPADEALERGLLRVVQHVARRTQEDHCIVSGQPRVAEAPRIFGRCQRPASLRRKPTQCLDAGRDRFVPVLYRAREHQQRHAIASCRSRSRCRARARSRAARSARPAVRCSPRRHAAELATSGADVAALAEPAASASPRERCSSASATRKRPARTELSP